MIRETFLCELFVSNEGVWISKIRFNHEDFIFGKRSTAIRNIYQEYRLGSDPLDDIALIVSNYELPIWSLEALMAYFATWYGL